MINQAWITTWDHLSIQCLTVSYQVASYYYNPSDWHSLIFLSIACIYIYVCPFQINFQWNPNTWRWEPWEPQKPRETRTLPGSFCHCRCGFENQFGKATNKVDINIHQVKTCKLQSPEIFVFHQFLYGLWKGFWVLNANFQQLWGRFGSLMWEIVVVSWAWLGWVVTWGINDPLGVEVFLHHWFFDRKFRWKAMQIL